MVNRVQVWFYEPMNRVERLFAKVSKQRYMFTCLYLTDLDLVLYFGKKGLRTAPKNAFDQAIGQKPRAIDVYTNCTNEEITDVYVFADSTKVTRFGQVMFWLTKGRLKPMLCTRMIALALGIKVRNEEDYLPDGFFALLLSRLITGHEYHENCWVCWERPGW